MGSDSMLVVFEGPSRAGKSTIQTELKKMKPDWVFYDGFSLLDIGVNKWETYIELEHKILNRLNKMNIEKPIVIDRLFSEYVYAKDGEKWLHFFKHHKCIIIYVDSSDTTLKSRNTKGVDLETIRSKYEELLSNFKHIRINTDAVSPFESAIVVRDYILECTNKEKEALIAGAKS